MKSSCKLKQWVVATAALLSGGLAHSAEINVIENATFPENSYYPWAANVWAGDATAGVRGGGNPSNRFCLVMNNPSANEWDINLRHEGIPLIAGQAYQFSADVWTSTTVDIKVATGSPDADFHFGTFGNADGPHFNVDGAPLTGTPQTISRTFNAPTSSASGPLPAETTGWFDFQLGGGLVPAGATVCFDNVQLITEAEEEEPKVSQSPVEVNQHGYLPGWPMNAVYALPSGVADTQTPRAWALYREGIATAVKTGGTSSYGSYGPAGQQVHLVDFTDSSLADGDYHLEVEETGGADTYKSHSFSVGSDLYTDLKYDALAYFYHNRSNAEIDASVVGSEWARGKGHIQDDSVQTIACKSASATHDCLTLDVSGGWYDAGDHGKYVVNGGISAWTLMNQYERSKHLGANLADFVDGSDMALPAGENADGVPDILNEAAWEVKWLMKMQVPEGTNAGMAYHKMHSEVWANVPWDPSSQEAYDEKRYIWGPSTAATLNFAAVGAQCYRVFKGTGIASDDPSYASLADECLDKAVLAYETAADTPYVPSPPETVGGGAYPDGSGGASAVDDEFYWAATELYLATHNTGFDRDIYGSAIAASPDHPGFGEYASHQSVMNWQNTGALGVLSLATVGEAYAADSSWVDAARAAVKDSGANYATAATGAPYGVPFDPANMYWGSNSNVLNNMLVMGLARDFSCDTETYDEALQQSMNYLLGLNPLDRSYVSGYGKRPVRHPHHRFWADQGDFPAVPPGAVAGGPNGDITSWTEKENSFLPGCESAPLTCYMDDISSYATNEITVNWNAPLAWVVAYMDEAASGATPQSCGGLVAEDATLDLGSSNTGTLDLSALNQSLPGDTFVIVDGPSFGTASIDSGVLTYTVDTVSSEDTLTYQIHRGSDVSTVGQVAVQLQPQSPLSCSWNIVRDVDDYNNFWEAEVLLENNTADDISSWELLVTVGADNVVGYEWHDAGYTRVSGDEATQSTWSVEDRGWDGFIPAGGNRTLILSGYDPTVKHWESGFDGYTPANVVSIGGDCGTPAEKTVDIVSLEGGDSNVFTGDDFITLSWYNNSGKVLYIEDEQGNVLPLTRRDDPVRIIPDGTWTRMEARIYHLREMTSLDMSPGTHTWTVATDSGLAQEISSSVSFTVSSEAVMRCSVGVTTRYNDGDWLGSFELTNTSNQVVSNWSLLMQWPSEDYTDAPASIQNVFGSDKYTVEQVEPWIYRIVANTSIAPGEMLTDVYRGNVWPGSDTWAVSEPEVTSEPGGLRCY